ncbi:gamma-glutamyl-gamma-aminobutyrate hydrolase family protein [Polymorphum gilvum]|uniref:gamma-glutamyl-gamma-aminobutyrate hydrolase n=1 Tax=Polymorphum gilvum (strain LMG 25793 / CGMCC 1.9160 / SL003B-26A1) TaxID=991905 RepID=F2IWF1_POLGS|nr:gamma-glutamyl-gamma-aminobutyrate hydrolase family protein [Polymorphum gilvum]ADZ69250.1 Class I glutamine amidotransferase, putative [Polymorphum gilvum SL003B-26A1]
MTKPLVLVTADVKAVDGYRWHAATSTYLEAVLKGSNAIPMILPSLGAAIDLDAALDRVDGVLATGSRSNVNPDLYGGEASEANGPYDPDRDATTLPLLRRAIERGIPVLAICRGMQELNVAMGGTLLTEIQDMEGRHDHRAPASDVQDERFAIAHPIEIRAGGALHAALAADSVEVNSLHRQALGDLGRNLVVEARAEDGTIEAVSVKEAPGFVLATQWHPEYWIACDGPSQKLFGAFGRAVEAYRLSRCASLAAE